MRFVRIVVVMLALSAIAAASANAAPVAFTLTRTSVLFNEDPAGAPLPLGRTQYDAGDVLFNGQKVGEYLRVKDVHAGTMNVAAVTLTLFFPNPAGGAPIVITLQGSHDFNTGGEIGGISASSLSGVAGIGFTFAGTGTLTLLFP